MKNSYLEKIALTRLVKELAKGTVSKPVSELAEGGFLRPRALYEQQAYRVNEKLGRKNNVVFREAIEGTQASDRAIASGGLTAEHYPGKSVVRYHELDPDYHPLVKDRMHMLASLRHELFEGIESNSLHLDKARRLPRKGVLDNAESVGNFRSELTGDPTLGKKFRVVAVKEVRHMRPVIQSRFVTSAGHVGTHATPGVLVRESEMVRKNPYLKHLHKFREVTGEAGLISDLTGKRYGSEKMTGTDLRKAFSATPTRYDTYLGKPIPVFENLNHGNKEVINKLYSGQIKNKDLEKYAGLPGSFLAVAQKDAKEGILNTSARSGFSGLPVGPNVSPTKSLKPRVIQNRTGMNRGALLNKIAQIIVNSDSSLPYRRRVEVAIFKGDKVLLTKNKDSDSGDSWFGFPGGGTEGDEDEVAAEKECLEEVGVQVKNLKRTEILHVTEGISAKKGRQDKYRGSRTRMFTALFDEHNDSKLGDDNDSVKFVWKTKDEAVALLKDNKVDPAYRIQTLKEYWPR